MPNNRRKVRRKAQVSRAIQNRKTEFMRRVNIIFPIIFANGEAPATIRITLDEVMKGQTGVSDHFDEFKFEKVVVKTGMIEQPHSGGTPLIPTAFDLVGCPDYNTAAPTNIGEIRRMAGHRSVMIVLDRLPVTKVFVFQTKRPVFPIQDSDTEFKNGFIPCTTNGNTRWMVGNIAPGYLPLHTTWAVHFDLQVDVVFRGFQ